MIILVFFFLFLFGGLTMIILVFFFLFLVGGLTMIILVFFFLFLFGGLTMIILVFFFLFLVGGLTMIILVFFFLFFSFWFDYDHTCHPVHPECWAFKIYCSSNLLYVKASRLRFGLTGATK